MNRIIYAVKQRGNSVTTGGLMAGDPRESAVNRRRNGGLMEGNRRFKIGIKRRFNGGRLIKSGLKGCSAKPVKT